MVIREGSPDMLDGSDKRMVSAPIKATEAVKQEDVVHYNSTGDIKATKEAEGEEEGLTDAAAKKKTLQAQYADLQQQFSKWQQQIVDNQELLAKKRIIADEEDKKQEAVIPVAPSIPEAPQSNHRRLIKADSEGVARQPTSPVYKARPSSVSDLPANVGLAGKFSGEDLAIGRANLRQNSQEEKRPQSMHYGADGRKQSLSKKGGFSIGSAYHGVSLSVPQQNLKAPPASAPVPPASSSAPKRIVRPSVESLLDPREELMISIRNKGGMAGLRKVPVDETNW
ncbi:hypothetical protein CAPTEDRAFT_225879 [Capitella teleta]|uniref:WH2 domain-containing protein n=1 Tax=Capitella teleta TaxID=283909 RepID=R7UAE0_CAPTE|nr:hypothetical protein CAPTEDRAFT_225879 [Capitella teleta]|eukprot:ELU00111.1 hypothetical protein CAPTEDRAFT_225879 [Capitella teleta]